MFDDSIPISGLSLGLYPERKESSPGAVDRIANDIAGAFVSCLSSGCKKYEWIIQAVKSNSAGMNKWSESKIYDEAFALRSNLRRSGFKDELVARSFAIVREAARRTLDMPHYDVQLIGGLVLLKGMIAEMETGEGKTLVATLPACTAALAGVPVHIITVNDYLARRDAEWMAPVYRMLGLSVGTIVHGMSPEDKRITYRSDVTYCTNKEITFDYLRDRIVLWDRPSQVRLQVENLYGRSSRINNLLLRGLHYAIIDEADSVLIDEARTPLIISSEAEGLYKPAVYEHAVNYASGLTDREDYSVIFNENKIDLTGRGKKKINRFDWSGTIFQANEEQRQELIRQALVALYLFHRDKHYLIKDGKIQIIDEFTGRLMEDRSWERGLHQLIEVKEGCEVTQQKDTKARISYQRFFRRYLKLAGMTGSAKEVAGELWSTYKTKVIVIPPNRASNRMQLPPSLCRSSDEKWRSIIKAVSEMHKKKRPVLVGTRSVEASEYLSVLLNKAGMTHRVLNARQDREEADIIAMAGQLERITVATNMAGRGTDILLGPGVPELGGLHVIASELHESHRIDRQLFGRCGRQGDPGSCQAIISFEDELILKYAEKMFRLLAGISYKPIGRNITRWIEYIIFRMAQRSAERMHHRMRRELLSMDDRVSESLAFTGQTE